MGGAAFRPAGEVTIVPVGDHDIPGDVGKVIGALSSSFVGFLTFVELFSVNPNSLRISRICV